MPEVSPSNAALAIAISLYRQPVLARKLVRSELPVGMALVLKIAAEGTELAAPLAGKLGVTVEELHQACLLYLQTVVFHQHASDARLLALTEPIDPSELLAHKRMIFKWLHPDRNHNSWENKLSLRVKAAILRLERGSDPLVPVPTGSVASPPTIRRHLRHGGLSYIQRQPIPNFWSHLLRIKIISIFLALLVLGVSGWALLALTSGVHRFDFGYEASN